jgi:hypothetical protein
MSIKGLPKPLKTLIHDISTHHVPTKMEEVMEDSKLTRAIRAEMETLMKNKTYHY